MINIYFLEKNDIPFYIGKTKLMLSERIYGHQTNFGLDIGIELLDEVDESNWKFWESFYIQLFLSWEYKLLNQNDGGGGPSFHTKETKEKIGLKHLGLKKPKTSEKLKGRIYSDKTLEKMSNSHLGSKKDWLYVKIYQFDKNMNFIKEWESLKEVINYYPIKVSSLSNALNGHSKSCMNYIWVKKKNCKIK